MRLAAEPLPIDDGQIDSPVGQHIVPAHQVWRYQWRVHGAPWEQAGMEFRWRRRPRPGAHDGQRPYTFRVAHREAEAGRAAPVVAHDREAAQIKLTDKAGEIGDVPVEAVRMLARWLLGQAEADHIGDDDAVSRLDQGRNNPAVEEAPGRVAVQQQNGIARALIDIVHSPAVDPGVARRVGPLHAKPVEALKRISNHITRLTSERTGAPTSPT